MIVDWLNRATGTITLFLIISGLVGPKFNESIVERIGTGAHIVLLLDVVPA